jgi:uncharacterized protein (TIGR02147 family)
MQPTNFREFLRHEYVKRASKNEKYSMRAFARQVGIPSSMLSNVLSGKKKLSPERAFDVAKKLSLSEIERKHFLLLNHRDSTPSVELKGFFERELRSLPPIRNKRFMPPEQLNTLSEFQMIMLCQLCGTHGATIKKISRKLGVPLYEAEAGVKKLIDMGLLYQIGEVYKKTERNMSFESRGPNLVLRKIHRLMMEKATEALETQTNDEKFIGTEILSFDPSLLPEAMEILNEAFDKITALSEHLDDANHVYGMGIQLVRLTKND